MVWCNPNFLFNQGENLVKFLLRPYIFFEPKKIANNFFPSFSELILTGMEYTIFLKYFLMYSITYLNKQKHETRVNHERIYVISNKNYKNVVRSG